MVPDPVLLRFLSEYQQDLAVLAFGVDDEFMAQQASIVIATDAENKKGTAGSNTAGGFPVTVNEAGDISASSEEAGHAVEFDWAKAQRLVEPRPVLSATALSATFSSPGWAANVYVGAMARVVAGRGVGQVRLVIGNTVDTLQFDVAWDTPLNSSSMVEVVLADPGVDETVFSVAVSGSPKGERQGFLVRLDANGQPFIDVSRPIVAQYGKGIPLPPHLRLLGASISMPTNTLPGVFRRDNSPLAAGDSSSLEFTNFHSRHYAAFPSAYVLGGELYLAGDADSWTSGLTMDLRYVPIPPAFSSFRDFVFIPGCDRVLREAGALFAADRLLSLGVDMDIKRFAAARQRAEELFIEGIRSRDTGYTFVTRDVNPY